MLKEPYGNQEKKKKVVIISFDAEFSINRAFIDPLHNKPCADRIFSPNPEGTEGITDILNVLSNHQVKATFFTEVLNSYYFGSSKMHKYVKEMINHNQDIQLHTHPCWLIFKQKNWQNNLKERLIRDDFDHTSHEDIVKIIKDCLAIFNSWDLPPPIAFRAGNLHPKLDLYNALHELNFKISSSIDIPIYKPKEKKLQISNELAFFHHIAEFPVTSYQSMGYRDKALTITGSSFHEIKSVLQQSIKCTRSPVIILSHIHEFIKINPKNGLVRRNKLNLGRLNSLCEYVKESPDFEFKAFCDLENLYDFKEEERKRSYQLEKISTSIAAGLLTLIQNKLNDNFWLL